MCHLLIYVRLHKNQSDVGSCHMSMTRDTYSAYAYVRDLILRASLPELKFERNAYILIIP